MNRRTELLPESLLWSEGGHLSDEALCAYADGQTSILPGKALAHADGCDDCTARLGRFALSSWELAGALGEADAAWSAASLDGSATSSLATVSAVVNGSSAAHAPLVASLSDVAHAAGVANAAGVPTAASNSNGAARPSAPSLTPASVRRPLPWGAFAAALALAALTSLPSAGLVLQWLRTAWAVWPRVLPQLPALGDTLRALVASALGPLGHAMPLLASLIMVLTGCAVANAALKIRSQKGTILS